MMAEGVIKQQWQHTSSIMAVVHNTQVTKKSDLKKPSDFDPFSEKPKRFIAPDAFAILRAIFVPDSLQKP